MPSSQSPELNKIVEELQQGKTATPVTARQFLDWFGLQRRTALNVEYINKELEKAGVRTVPSYLEVWIDTPITFELSTHADSTFDPNVASPPFEESNANMSAEDPSFRIGNLAAANNKPIAVKPNAKLGEALTLMMAKNFSQLPVMTSDRVVKGIISWASIGARQALGRTGPDVQFYMDEHQEVPASASLYAGIQIIAEYGFVLVRSSDQTISGIVTSNDIALQFEEISTPFLLLSEIENQLRHLISAKLSHDQIKRSIPEHSLKNFTKIPDLSLGDAISTISNEENWADLGLNQFDRSVFCRELDEVREIRNEIMHFNPDPPTKQKIEKLRNMARVMSTIRAMGVF